MISVNAAALLKNLRKQRELTQRELADLIAAKTGEKLAPQSISKWESGSIPEMHHARFADQVLQAKGALLEAWGYANLLSRPAANGDQLSTIEKKIDTLLSLIHGHGAVLFELARQSPHLSEEELARLLQAAGAPPPP